MNRLLTAARSAIALQGRPTVRGRRRPAVIKGQDITRWTDFYHAVLTVPWREFFLGWRCSSSPINVAFALLYMADPHGIAARAAGQFLGRLLVQRADHRLRSATA